MKICRFCSVFLSIILLAMSCIEPYAPPSSDGEVNYLVVDGSVNSADGTVSVRLSRAVPLASTQPSPRELNAQLSLEDNDGNTFPIAEVGGGLYQQINLSIDDNKQYRLHIKTTDNNEYSSDFITIKETPEIDSVNWAPTASHDGIDIFVTTHDDSKNTRYYQWSFEETYKYEAIYYSYLKLEGEDVVQIPNEDLTYECWKTIPSTNILIGSSERLNEDIIYQFPITTIPKGSQKMFIKYSILVIQKALTREAYDYWLNLQKTTEHLGTLFDPQPGQVTGNIHSETNPKLPVLGYFDAGSSKEKRIFIENIELPNDLRFYKSIGACVLDTVMIADLPDFNSSASALVSPILSMGPFPVAYSFTTPSCADCRFEGGVTNKPDFWE